MENINLSPVNQAYVQQNQQQVVTNPKNSNAPEQKKDGKKLLIAGATVAAAIGVATILIATHKSHKLKKILAESESIQKTSEEIIEKGQKLYDEAQGVVDEILDLFNKGKASNFTDVLDENGNVIVKYNLNSDGELDTIIQTGVEGFKKRIGRFTDGILKTIETRNNDNLVDCITMYADPEIFTIEKGIENFADGSLKIQESFDFCDRKLFNFQKGAEILADKSRKMQEEFSFRDGKIEKFLKGFEIFANGSNKTQELCLFVDGKLWTLNKGIENLADGSVKIQEEFKLQLEN